MDEANSADPLDFEARFRRSRGRSGRTFSATAKVTREEHNELEAAAKAEGKALGEWSREALLASARRTVPTPVFTEVIALRMLLNNVLRQIACGETMTPEAFSAQMHSVRASKHKAAEEVMQQYAATEKG